MKFMKSPNLLAAVCLISCGLASFVMAHPALDKLEIKSSKTQFHGFQQDDFKLPGTEIPCHLVSPKNAAKGNPWIWRARFWGHQPDFDLAFLEKGYHIAYCDVTGLYGSPTAVARWDQFYELSQKLALNKKPILEGMSRGGLIIFNWAKANPEKVSAIYGDNPVCDISSWPKAYAPKEWKECMAAYKLDEKSLQTFTGNPIDKLEDLAAAKVPVFLVLGAKDDVVPIANNALVLEKLYRALGGSVTKWIKPEDGHHPHGLHPVTPLVEAVVKSLGD